MRIEFYYSRKMRGVRPRRQPVPMPTTLNRAVEKENKDTGFYSLQIDTRPPKQRVSYLANAVTLRLMVC